MNQTDLLYKSSASWTPLPTWAHVFVNIGMTMATREDTHKRAVVGLALPARTYAASLVALGITIGKFSSSSRNIDAVARFQQLSELKINTPLFYRRDKELIKVFFDGHDEIEGEVKLRLKTNGGRYWITSKQALQVEFPTKEFSPSLKRSSRKVSERPTQFLSSLLGPDIAKAVVAQSSLDSLIIGPLHQLKEEIQIWPIALRANEDFVPGFLQDVIRVRRFSKGTQTYRSEVYYTHSNECENVGQETPTVVIFDSSVGFLKWRDFWPQSDWVVLFDQTEAEFDVAIQAFNDEYTKSSAGNRDLSLFPTVPNYIPFSMYQEEHK